MILERFYCCLLLTTISILAFGQRALQSGHLTSSEGLSQNTALCILQDHDDYIWIGTRDGLNKYNGHEIMVFQNIEGDSTSLSNNRILSLAEDHHQRLWIGTADGLNVYDKQCKGFRRIDLAQECGLTSRGIYSLFIDAQQRLWVGTFGGGVAICDLNKKEQFRSITIDDPQIKLSDFFIRTIIETPSEDIWLGTREHGILVFDSKGDYRLQIKATDVEYGLCSNEIRSCFVDDRKRIWMATEKDGCTCYDPQLKTSISYTENSPSPISDNVIRTIQQSPNGTIILGSLSGLDFISPTGEVSKGDQKVLAVQSVIFDRSNNMWVGTYYNGVYIFNDQDQNYYRFVESPLNTAPNEFGIVSAFAEDKNGNYWIGTEDVGIAYFNRRTQMIEPFHFGNTTDIKVKDIKFVPPSTLYVATYGNGFYIVDTKSRKFKQHVQQKGNKNSLSSNYIYSIALGENGQVWLATNYGGLCVFNSATQNFETVYRTNANGESMSDNTVFDVEIGPNGDLWIANQRTGLIRYDGQSFSHIRLFKNHRTVKSVYNLFFDSQQTLWVGTGIGLFAYNIKTGEQQRYARNDGLASNYVYGIVEDSYSNLWISGINGITRFPLSHYKPSVESSDTLVTIFTSTDGLQGNEFNKGACIKLKDGSLLFGGINGYNRFLPQEVVLKNRTKHLRLEHLNVLNKPVYPSAKGEILKKHLTETDGFVLQDDQSSFSIEYVALEYTHPEKTNYYYCLEGYDDEWVHAKSATEAKYTKVPPGNYTFKVRAINHTEHWKTNTASVNIKILKPLWRRPWAYIFYLGTFLLLVYFYYRWYIDRTQQQRLLQAEREKAQRIQEMDQLKSDFFSNVSHQFRTPLTLIAGPIEQLHTDTSIDEQEREHLMSLVDRNVDRLQQLISQLMDYSRLENNMINLQVSESGLSDFISHILTRFEDYLIQKKIELTYSNQIKSTQAQWFDKRVIENVISIILFNAAKHTPELGQIKIELMLDKNHQAIISIINTGSAIPKEKQQLIFDRFYSDGNNKRLAEGGGTGIGLSFAKKIIELHKGDIEVESENKVTAFHVKFPILQKCYTEDEQHYEELNHVDYIYKGGQAAFDVALEEVKILVVEDDPELRMFVCNQLKGAQIMEASNGKEAFKIAKKMIPDLIISDVMMPEMDGVELCSSIKSHQSTNHIPVILLTAKTAIDHRLTGIHSGADLYMDKPFNIQLLLANIMNLLEQRDRMKDHYKQPTDGERSNMYNGDDELLINAETIIQHRISDPSLTVEDLSKELGLSRSQLFRKFKTETSHSPNEFIKVIRLKHALTLLSERKLNITEISYEAGFSSPSHFISTFKKHYGKPPKEYIEFT